MSAEYQLDTKKLNKHKDCSNMAVAMQNYYWREKVSSGKCYPLQYTIKRKTMKGKDSQKRKNNQ